MICYDAMFAQKGGMTTRYCEIVLEGFRGNEEYYYPAIPVRDN